MRASGFGRYLRVHERVARFRASTPPARWASERPTVGSPVGGPLLHDRATYQPYQDRLVSRGHRHDHRGLFGADPGR